MVKNFEFIPNIIKIKSIKLINVNMYKYWIYN